MLFGQCFHGNVTNITSRQKFFIYFSEIVPVYLSDLTIMDSNFRIKTPEILIFHTDNSIIIKTDENQMLISLNY